jgi:hypothetical protein
VLIAGGTALAGLGMGTTVGSTGSLIDDIKNYEANVKTAKAARDAAANNTPLFSGNVYSRSEAGRQAQQHGYRDAEDLKEAYVSNNGSQFDMKHDTNTGEIYLESKDHKVQVPTGLYDIR